MISVTAVFSSDIIWNSHRYCRKNINAINIFRICDAMDFMYYRHIADCTGSKRGSYG